MTVLKFFESAYTKGYQTTQIFPETLPIQLLGNYTDVAIILTVIILQLLRIMHKGVPQSAWMLLSIQIGIFTTNKMWLKMNVNGGSKQKTRNLHMLSTDIHFKTDHQIKSATIIFTEMFLKIELRKYRTTTTMCRILNELKQATTTSNNCCNQCH